MATASEANRSGGAAGQARPAYDPDRRITPVSEAAVTIRDIGWRDVEDALRAGVADFKARPSHILFLMLLYPLVALMLARLSLGYDVLPLFFPVLSGLALVGPFIALGMYEISRRRERGEDDRWVHALGVLRAPARGQIAVMSVLLFGLFVAWLGAAMLIYRLTFGGAAPASIGGFIAEVLTTPHGWLLIILGHAAGFLFAVAVLTISVVSFPMLLDRRVSAAEAIATSIAAVRQNPRSMASWGAIVAASLMLGALPFFIGLAVVVPILGHATWHLYRRVVVPA
jgi:uncharacterized membrane protein